MIEKEYIKTDYVFDLRHGKSLKQIFFYLPNFRYFEIGPKVGRCDQHRIVQFIVLNKPQTKHFFNFITRIIHWVLLIFNQNFIK